MSLSLHADYLVEVSNNQYACATSYYYYNGILFASLSSNPTSFIQVSLTLPISGYRYDPDNDLCTTAESLSMLTDDDLFRQDGYLHMNNQAVIANELNLTLKDYVFLMALSGVLCGTIFGMFIWKTL